MIRYSFTLLVLCFCTVLFAQEGATITIDAAKTGNTVSTTLHGVFFEEISHAGEGGLYAEMVQNRGFEDANIPPGMTLQDGFIVPPRTPHFSMPDDGVSDWKMEWPALGDLPAWRSMGVGKAALAVSRTAVQPLNNATPHSMQVEISYADDGDRAEVINEGFWGMNIVAGAAYDLKFYLRDPGYKGNVTAFLQGADGSVLATYVFKPVGGQGWKEYRTRLTALKSDRQAKLVLAFNRPGKLWLDFVSLFPVNTFKGRSNGLRQDLAQYIADLKPAFIRWPGGCFVEGICIQSAPDWKQTIGPVESRVGTYGPWGYWTSNGFGYHEYLQYCEDVGAAALYVFNAGVSCDFRSGTFITDDSLQPYVQNALDAIEYAIGPVDSKWGKVRAAAGHPLPFPLQYVEIGNEQSGPRYAKRYNVFYAAIREKYPQIKMMASMGIGDVNEYTLRGMKQVDYADEHAYKAAGWAMAHFDHFDKYRRGRWDMYVGEYATNGGVGAGDMEASLSDAVYIMGMEKNGDLVKMSSYAPLLVNVHDIDWPVNLINFDAGRSFARISYYAIKMMNENRADVNLLTDVKVKRAAEPPPAFVGGIGLATWDTKTEYKDITVMSGDSVVYRSDFLNRLPEWGLVRGRWEEKDSALAQTATGAQQFAMLRGKSFSTYTLHMKARKLGGYNAFIIPFAVKDSNTFYRAHIGAWVNKVGVFEKVSNGYDVSNISGTTPLKDTIASGRWYDITLEVGIDTVKCYLDGALLMSYTEPDKLFAIAGKEARSGDVILKVVNAYDREMLLEVSLSHTGVDSLRGMMTTLTAPALTDENSFDRPMQYIPRSAPLQPVGGDDLSILVKPYSINVIRLKGN